MPNMLMTQGVTREWFWENHHPSLGGRRTSQLDGHKIWWRNQHLSEGLGRCTTFAWVCKDVMCNIFGYAYDTGGVREWLWENHQKIGPFRPWADGKPDNKIDEISAIASFQRGWDDALAGSPKYLMCEPKINFE